MRAPPNPPNPPNPNDPTQPSVRNQSTWGQPTGTTTPTNNATSSTSRFTGRALAGWTVAYALTWWFVFVGAISGNLVIYQLSLFALCGEGITVWAMNRRGKAPPQKPLSSNQRLGIGCLVLLFLPVVLFGLVFYPGFVFGKSIWQYYKATQQHPVGQIQAGWQSFQSQSRGIQVGTAASTLIVLCLLFSCTGGVFAGGRNAGLFPDSTPPASSGDTASISNGPAATGGPVSTDTPVPTDTPTPKPTATPVPIPTDTPIPLECTPAGCSPWGYDFTPGAVITSPPGNFCSYFRCIANFWNGRGYVVECQDSTYSKSGGISGSCSRHSGEWRILYQH